MPIRLHDLLPSLQVAIGPMILVSGVALLLLSMTNRLGRVIDRARELSMELRAGAAADHDLLRSQLDILTTRARLGRQAITLAIVSMLSAAVLVITLFVAAVLALEVGIVVVALFVGCMSALIGALVALLRDVNLSLAALKLELDR
ncbi:MAG: DUF2721 domain-containing protein [Acidobacteriota bacterium]